MRRHPAQFNLDGNGVALLLAEFDHRIRNLLTTIEAAVKQTRSTTVEDYRAKLVARITGLYSFCEFVSCYSQLSCLSRACVPTLQMALKSWRPDLTSSLNRIWRSRCISSHEFAANASKFGALNTGLGVRQRRVDGFGTFAVPLANSPSSYGGREVKHRRHAGFGSRLVKAVLDGYVGMRLDLNSTGLACAVGVDMDRPDARLEERTGTSRKCGSKPHSHSTRH
jgi:hypothetical protein